MTNQFTKNITNTGAGSLQLILVTYYLFLLVSLQFRSETTLNKTTFRSYQTRSESFRSGEENKPIVSTLPQKEKTQQMHSHKIEMH